MLLILFNKLSHSSTKSLISATCLELKALAINCECSSNALYISSTEAMIYLTSFLVFD